MFKRREDSQAITRQILDRIEKRVEDFFQRADSNLNLNRPNLTVIAKPVFPYRPVISKNGIFQLKRSWRKVFGGVCQLPEYEHGGYSELNEYGIVYQRRELPEEIREYGSRHISSLSFGVFLMELASTFISRNNFMMLLNTNMNLQCSCTKFWVRNLRILIMNWFAGPLLNVLIGKFQFPHSVYGESCGS